MSVAGRICAWVLAAVFVWAGAAKLARPAATESGFRSLGLPASRALARLVPIVELALAVVLIAAPPVGGVIALALLVGFSAALVRALRAGVTAGCACFGTTATRRISGRDVARNAALAVLAVAAGLV